MYLFLSCFLYTQHNIHFILYIIYYTHINSGLNLKVISCIMICHCLSLFLLLQQQPLFPQRLLINSIYFYIYWVYSLQCVFFFNFTKIHIPLIWLRYREFRSWETFSSRSDMGHISTKNLLLTGKEKMSFLWNLIKTLNDFLH